MQVEQILITSYQQCGYPRAYFGHAMQGKLNSPDVYHCVSKARSSIMTGLKQQPSDSSKMPQVTELLEAN